MIVLRHSICAGWLLAAVLLGGCGTGARQVAGPLGDESLLRSSHEVAASELIPLRPYTCVYRDEEGLSAVYRLKEARQGAYLSQLIDRHIAQLKLGGDGAIIMPGEQDLQENVVIAYKPALMVMPAKLTQGQTVSHESKMLVKHADTRKVRDRGTCLVKITLLGRQTVRLSDGKVDAVVVRTVRHIKLKWADVVVTIIEAYQPDYGMIAQRVQRQIKVMGVPGPVLVKTAVLESRQADKIK